MSNKANLVPVICIDGPSGTGKGTITQLLAQHLRWHILDSGALYRVVAVGIEKNAISPVNTDELCRFANDMKVSFSSLFDGSIVLNGEEVSGQVRLEESAGKASIVAAIPALRSALFQRQLDFRQLPGLVADGRDMGTVVFPDAPLKFFLTASAKERAQRRHKQLITKGVSVTLRDLLQDIEARDERDSNRTTSPLIAAQDAMVVDTTELSIEAVMDIILDKVKTAVPSVS